jgi:hypothetical protein
MVSFFFFFLSLWEKRVRVITISAALDIRMAVAGPTITAIHPSTHKTALAHATLSRSLLENHVTAPSLLHKLGKAC